MKPSLMNKFALNLASPFFLSLFGISAVLFFVNCGLAVTYTVNNAGDFNNLPSLNAGDVVKMQSGIYGSINKTIQSNILTDDLAQSNPIKIYAANPGGVIIDAPSNIRFAGRGIIFAGVDFGSGCGLFSPTGYGEIVGADYDSRYITFSHLRFNACGSYNTSGEDVHWLSLRGFRNTIEYCSFINRPESSSNATVWIMPDISEGGIDVPRNHWIHHNYFGTRYAGTVNGFESIRIGIGNVQTFNMQVLVEKNVFFHSIWRSDGSAAGEPEIISNKSKGNIIRNNTILESQGGICLRTGRYCTVEGNFIFGAGAYLGNSIVMGQANVLQRGIRVIGKNHIIRNNYVANVTGTLAASALCVMSGESNYDEGDPVTGRGNSGSYLPADDAEIYNNTFIDCAQMNFGYLASDSYTAAISPARVKVYNNVWQGNGTASLAVVQDNTSTSSAPGYTPIVLGGSGGNYIYETSSGKCGWNGLGGTYSAAVSPGIIENFGNYKIPTSSSPLLGAADATLCATTDIRGFTRPSTARDIGCYERDATGITAYAPMLRSEVGAVFDGGPASSPFWKLPVITSSLTAIAYRNNDFSYFITAANEATSFSATNLPTGLLLDSATGKISGIPKVLAGTYSVTLKANNSDGSTSAILDIQVSEDVSTYQVSTNWICPANVTAVQVECWGAGGAGGSALRTGGSGTVQYGGGGAGGAYAKTLSIPVVAGNTYYINVGTCSSNSSAVTSNSVAGGDSWFNSNNVPSTLVLAKGGAGGNSAVGNTTNTAYATAGSGTTTGSIGNVLYAGGSGANGLSGFAGGGGSGAASTTSGVAATNNVGAVSAAGGGTGGTGVTSGSLPGGSGSAPGGGGAGARNSSGTVSLGGAGGAGQVILTIKALAAASNPPVIGPTFATVFGAGVNPTNVGADGLAYLMKYALGGTNTNDSITLPTVSVTGSMLTMSAIVRTNDTNLAIVGQSLTNLAGLWSDLSQNPYGTASTNTNSVPAGCQRRDFSVDRGTNNQQFLRLKATQNP